MGKKLIIFGIVILTLLIPISFANGGCIKVADDVLVQLSSSPLVPVIDKEASFLISFADTQKELIKEEITGKIWITKNENKVLIKDFKIKDGILDLKHTFENPGLYEIFLNLNIRNKTYAPEDFLIEVKDEDTNYPQNLLFLVVGIIIGGLSLKFIGKRK